MWKINFVECRPVGGQRGVHRDPNTIGAQHAAQFFSNTCQKMRGGKYVKVRKQTPPPRPLMTGCEVLVWFHCQMCEKNI